MAAASGRGLPNPSGAARDVDAFDAAARAAASDLAALEASSSASAPRDASGLAQRGRTALRLRARQVSRWAAESLGVGAKRGEDRIVLSEDLWDALRHACVAAERLESGCMDSICIAVVEALTAMGAALLQRRGKGVGGDAGSAEDDATTMEAVDVIVMDHLAPIHYAAGGAKRAVDLLHVAADLLRGGPSHADRHTWEAAAVGALRACRICEPPGLAKQLCDDGGAVLVKLLALIPPGGDAILGRLPGMAMAPDRHANLPAEVLLFLRHALLPADATSPEAASAHSPLTPYGRWLDAFPPWGDAPPDGAVTAFTRASHAQALAANRLARADARGGLERTFLAEAVLIDGVARGREGVWEAMPWLLRCFSAAAQAEASTRDKPGPWSGAAAGGEGGMGGMGGGWHRACPSYWLPSRDVFSFPRRAMLCMKERACSVHCAPSSPP